MIKKQSFFFINFDDFENLIPKQYHNSQSFFFNWKFNITGRKNKHYETKKNADSD